MLKQFLINIGRLECDKTSHKTLKTNKMKDPILSKTLNEMPLVFSSNQFAKTARINGYSDHLITHGRCGHFLLKNAIQGDTKRIWHKRKNRNANNIDNYKKIDVEYCIEFLKEKGYRILKPINEWKEV